MLVACLELQSICENHEAFFSLPGSSRFVLNESPTRPSPSSSQGGSAEGTVAAGGQGLPQPPPGMSVYAAKRVIGESQWSAEQLEQVQWVKLEDHLLSSDLFCFFLMVFLKNDWLNIGEASVNSQIPLESNRFLKIKV